MFSSMMDFGAWVKRIAIGVLLCVIGGFPGWIIYRLWEVIRWILEWCDPLIADSEVGSCASPSVVDGSTSFSDHTRPLISPLLTGLPAFPLRAAELFVDSPADIVVSPHSAHTDDGKGVFSSLAIRRAMETECCGSPPDVRCAHQVFPFGELSQPMGFSPCLLADIKEIMLIEEETIILDGFPHPPPAGGGEVWLRTVHEHDYRSRSSPYRCVASGCLGLGFSVQLSEKKFASCAVRLQHQIDSVAGLDSSDRPENGGATAKRLNCIKVTLSAPPDARDVPGDPVTRALSVAMGKVVDSAQSSASESWADREKDLKKITSKRYRKRSGLGCDYSPQRKERHAKMHKKKETWPFVFG